MSRLLIAALAAVLLVGAGCQGDKNKSKSNRDQNNKSKSAKADDAKMMAADGDVCTHCQGDQAMATAAGKCPKCGTDVADACGHCEGVQTASGTKCPKCNTPWAKKAGS